MLVIHISYQALQTLQVLNMNENQGIFKDTFMLYIYIVLTDAHLCLPYSLKNLKCYRYTALNYGL